MEEVKKEIKEWGSMNWYEVTSRFSVKKKKKSTCKRAYVIYIYIIKKGKTLIYLIITKKHRKDKPENF